MTLTAHGAARRCPAEAFRPARGYGVRAEDVNVVPARNVGVVLDAVVHAVEQQAGGGQLRVEALAGGGGGICISCTPPQNSLSESGVLRMNARSPLCAVAAFSVRWTVLLALSSPSTVSMSSQPA